MSIARVWRPTVMKFKLIFSDFVIKILFKFHMNLGEWLLVRSSSFQNTTSLLMKQYRIQELF